MNRTSLPRSARPAHPSEETPEYITDELRRYDEHLRDVRGLAAGTRRDRYRVVACLLRQRFAGRAIDMAKLRPDDVRRLRCATRWRVAWSRAAARSRKSPTSCATVRWKPPGSTPSSTRPI